MNWFKASLLVDVTGADVLRNMGHLKDIPLSGGGNFNVVHAS